jgi:hypothetical protein
LLPQQLQSLQLWVRSDLWPSDGLVTVALGYVTALKELKLTLQCSAAPGSSLPSSLTALTVCIQEDDAADSTQFLGLTALQKLQRLEAGRGLEQPQLMKQPSTLAALTDVQLCCEGPTSAQRVAPGWQHLSGLRSLRLENQSVEAAELDPTQGARLLQGLAAATSLIHLDIEGPIVHESLHVCEHLTGLSQLQTLRMDRGVSSQSDALKLAALTSLTHLNVFGAAGVDDVAASALALRLTRLQSLQLGCCSLRSAAPLASIASLTGWTSLSLSSWDQDTEGYFSFLHGPEDVLVLAPLTRLKHCYVDWFNGIPADLRL